MSFYRQAQTGLLSAQGTMDAKEGLPGGSKVDVAPPGDRTGTQPQADQPDMATRRVHGKHTGERMRAQGFGPGLSAPGVEEEIEGTVERDWRGNNKLRDHGDKGSRKDPGQDLLSAWMLERERSQAGSRSGAGNRLGGLERGSRWGS